MKAYCTKNNILVTGETSNFYKKTVFSIPIDKCVDGRSKPTYYTSIAIFLQHLICSATASRNTKKKLVLKAIKNGLIQSLFLINWVINMLPGFLSKAGSFLLSERWKS
ncbi:hypothetical protein [Klebsiella grimontii]|uniref:hypothetical protein n=1 Tax=Klebsiella grimontii TaxID=2058152 RepID=UPI0021149BC9|nr:hypothetical protein [Klebsiella grimontii]